LDQFQEDAAGGCRVYEDVEVAAGSGSRFVE
jgi:hypothetical protein